MMATFAAAAVIGIVIGLLSGMLGIGGGMVMVPVFRLLFGMSAVGSTATSLFTIIPTSISGVVSHSRRKTCVPKFGVALGVGGACTSWLGVWLAQLSPGWCIMCATALAIAYSAVTMLRKAIKAPRPSGDGEGAPIPQPSLSTSLLVKSAGIGAVAGVVSGYVGLGGGFIMVPLMLSLLHIPMKLASGTSLIAVFILALPASIMQCVLGNVDYLVGIAVACGSIPGAVAGARLVSRIPERSLRLIFAVLLGVAAALLVLKEFGIL